jgi:VWFA-related protein
MSGSGAREISSRAAAAVHGRIMPFLVLLFLASNGLHGQVQPQAQVPAPTQPPVKVDVKVVSVLATVRDKKSAIVSNLGKDDFVLEEDGKSQAMSYFAHYSELPLTLGLLVDTSRSQRNVIDQERAASRTFLQEMLKENDRAFVIHFDREVELLQALTSSEDKLSKALDLVETSRPQFANRGGGNGGGYPGGGGGRSPGGGYPSGGGQQLNRAGTLLYDAIFLASDEVIKKEQGRKALIVLSDGVDHGSQESLESAIMTAQRADAIVYSIYFPGEEGSPNPFGGFGGPGMGRQGGAHRYPHEERVDGKKILERISRETGGRAFEVSKKQTVGDIYDAIAEELRNQYSIGYTPASDAVPGYHKINLTTKQKDMTVQAREGYYNTR